MAEWTAASDRDRLATSADFATSALAVKYGSMEEAIQKLGSNMDNLLPYATALQNCITAVGASDDLKKADKKRWRKSLTAMRMNVIGATCVVWLKYSSLPDGRPPTEAMPYKSQSAAPSTSPDLSPELQKIGREGIIATYNSALRGRGLNDSAVLEVEVLDTHGHREAYNVCK
jgi:hypothetical protein